MTYVINGTNNRLKVTPVTDFKALLDEAVEHCQPFKRLLFYVNKEFFPKIGLKAAATQKDVFKQFHSVYRITAPTLAAVQTHSLLTGGQRNELRKTQLKDGKQAKGAAAATKSAAKTHPRKGPKAKQPSSARSAEQASMRVPPGSKPTLVIHIGKGANSFIYAGHMKQGKFVGKNSVLKVDMGSIWSGRYEAEIGSCKLKQTYVRGCPAPYNTFGSVADEKRNLNPREKVEMTEDWLKKVEKEIFCPQSQDFVGRSTWFSILEDDEKFETTQIGYRLYGWSLGIKNLMEVSQSSISPTLESHHEHAVVFNKKPELREIRQVHLVDKDIRELPVSPLMKKKGHSKLWSSVLTQSAWRMNECEQAFVVNPKTGEVKLNGMKAIFN